ncbi:unnamed protein product [Cylicocyclus nassatus]|uniref:Uncharacterized protein n=1 Tax=Cylicocyclus nassatus TaxID=53992 RepID=A0AA36DKH3_CYLNA|nr:unnamed protein product [Cylicocyclus nassatus]
MTFIILSLAAKAISDALREQLPLSSLPINIWNVCRFAILLFPCLFCTSRAEEMTYSSVFDAYEATVSPLLLMDNASNTVSPMIVERIARGKTILQKLKSHIFGPDEEVHESDLIRNCNGALCDNELVHLLGESYKGKCRAKRGRCFKVYDEEHDNHMSMGRDIRSYEYDMEKKQWLSHAKRRRTAPETNRVMELRELQNQNQAYLALSLE